MLRLAALLAASLFAAEPAIERRGAAAWPTRNHMRVAVRATYPAGEPVLLTRTVPAAFNPDSVRVTGPDSTAPVPAKVEWHTPRMSVCWRSAGPGTYHVYFDEDRAGETVRAPEPAMVGAGDRITFGKPGVIGDLAVGLWVYPGIIDFDRDGNWDVIISSPTSLSGIWLFRNIGSNSAPLFDRGEWWGPGKKGLVIADFNGDGKLDLVFQGGYYSDVRRNRLSQWVPVKLKREYYADRENQWYPVDWDGDGKLDIIAGVSDWRDYGWDDAFNEKGEWTRGPLHGYVYFHRNIGTNQNPEYAPAVQIYAGEKPIDQYGTPAPNPIDWYGTGRLDLIAGNFIDEITFFRNIGTRTAPRFAPGELLQIGGKPFRMELCMIQPRAIRWHEDGRPSLIVGEEDGRVAFFDNRAPRGKTPDLAPPVRFRQVDPYVKAGVLARPVAVDWNADGKLDLLVADASGYFHFFENTATTANPVFVEHPFLKAGGTVIRRLAGSNRSVQGPAEAKWGYPNFSAADWDLDGTLDLVVNDIYGEVVWYRNVGTSRAPELAAAQNVDVEWVGPAPKPDWVWWEPEGKQLLTQWRTTPKVVDWDRDGLPDLVMLDYRGYLCLYRRARRGGNLVLLPPEPIFLTERGEFLLLSAKRGGSSGRRKIELVDWDGDGDLDLITDGGNGAVWYENVGSQAKPLMQLRGDLLPAGFQLHGHNPTPNVADWNGDGKLDLIVGGEDGFLYYFDRRFLDRQRAAGRPR
jgi:hypothetical protein